MPKLSMMVSRMLVAIVLVLVARIAVSADTIENANLAFSVAANGYWELLDKTTNEVWRSNPDSQRFARVTAASGSSTSTYSATSFASMCNYSNSMVLVWSPNTNIGTMRFAIQLLPDGKSVKVSWAQSGGTWQVTDVRFPDSSFRATAAQGGYLVAPNRMGIMVPAGEKISERRTYPTYGSYGGCSMAMGGAVKNGSAILVSWEDPYCSLETYRGTGLSYVDMSVLHKGSSGFVIIRPVGSGGYLEIAQAYRDVARDRGLLVTWADKFPSGGNPLAGREYLSSMCVYNNSSGGGKTVEATFTKIAEIAEHFKNDIGIDNAMYNLWGWQNMGYDRHPDNLPAAPECGGNAGLIDCSNRVKACGYLFGLRDNYQDIYTDSPSWNPDLVRRKKDGSLWIGGVWAGGQAYFLNSQKGFELAQRSTQNIPAIKSLFNPTSFYIDTVFASPLMEDFSSVHPLTLKDDLYWKRRLCQYARQTFGIFGSEEGYEWGVPCADFFESLMTARTSPTSSEVQIPLFEMVYGDCVQMYQGDRTTVQTPKSVLDHILCAELPVMWVDRYDASKPWCRISSARRTASNTIQVTYAWKTYSLAPQGNYGFVAQYADPASTDCWAAVFSDTHAFGTPTTQWPVNGTYTDGPITIVRSDVVAPAAGEKYFDVYVFMMTNPDGSGNRVPVRGFDICLNNGYIGGYTKYYIGRLTLRSDGTIGVSYPVLPDLYNFGRCDTKRDSSYQNDGLILNTYKICSPLNRITSNTPMTYHAFLTSDRTVQRSRFGDVEITVNYGTQPYTSGAAILPQYGFLVESPTLVAFRANSYGGRTFSETTLALATSNDGNPISSSSAVDTYRAYGDKTVTIAGRDFLLY